jgi:hypothetical protein
MSISAGDQDALIAALETGDLPGHDSTQVALGSGVLFRIQI